MSVVSNPSETFMQCAIESARRGMAAGEPPIGACLVRDSEAISTAHNSVVSALDITAHAEIVVIREACQSLHALDLSGCHLYVTVEPCAMCIGACHYAGISLVVFGARLADIDELTGNELGASHSQLVVNGNGTPVILGDFMRNDCLDLLREWGRPS
jgi:tRNA(Arg) A34 adenosine deaminase TadA